MVGMVDIPGIGVFVTGGIVRVTSRRVVVVVEVIDFFVFVFGKVFFELRQLYPPGLLHLDPPRYPSPLYLYNWWQ